MKITITKQEYQTIVRCLKTSEILIRGYNLRDEDMIRKTRRNSKGVRRKVDMTFEEMKAQYCGKNIRKKPKHEEDDLQRACVCWFDLEYPQYRLRLHHSPNGGKRNAIEAAKFKQMGVRAGFPDLILLIPNKLYPFCGIELKTKTGRQSENQKEYQKEFESIGAKYVVVRSLEEFIEVVDGYLAEK